MRSVARLVAAALMVPACFAGPVAAQQEAAVPALLSPSRAPSPVDARLVPAQWESRRALELDTVGAVARPRWRYPVIGAAIGVAAGIIHAQAVERGDYVGLPAEPMYLFPSAYAAAGALIGLLVDSADRERRARRD